MSIHGIKEKAIQLTELLREINASLPDDAAIDLRMYGGPSGIYISVSYDLDEVKEYCSNETTVGKDMYKALVYAKKIAKQAAEEAAAEAVEASSLLDNTSADEK